MSEEPSAGITEDRLGIQVGRLALERHWISPEQLKAALSAQARESGKTARPRPLGDILLEQHALNSRQLKLLLAHEDDQKTRLAGASPKSAQRPPPSGPLPAGRFGKYQLFQKIGKGLAGVIYEAVDVDLGRKVALKMLESAGSQPDEEEEERLLREAKILGALPRHPWIAGVYDSGRIDGKRYIALEFVDGVPLNLWMNTGGISLREKIRVLRDCSLALQFAHQHGVIHRDLKPQSILVDASGAPHIVEFGLAVPKRVEVQASLTQTGFIVGTPGYMSPEQAEGKKSVDHRTDIYSLGSILFEMITGRRPFLGEKPIEILLKVVHGNVPRPSAVTQIGPVDRELEELSLKALSRRPAERPASAKAFAGELNAWLQQRARSNARFGSPARLAAAGAALIVLALFLFVATRKKEPPPSPKTIAAATPPATPAPPPRKPRSESRVTYEPGRESGLRHVPLADGPGELRSHDGKPCLASVPNPDGQRRLYFDVDDRWAESAALVEIEIDCLVPGPPGSLVCEYDSADVSTIYQGAFRTMIPFTLGPPGQWTIVKDILPATRFRNRQWEKADFRLGGQAILIRRISLRSLDLEDFLVSQKPRPVTTPADGLSPGLIGEYFSDLNFGRRIEQRVDADLRFRWPKEAVAGGPVDSYSVRWTGSLRIERSADILFESLNDDGVRIDVGAARIISDWIAHSPIRNLSAVRLDPGLYDFKVDFFDDWYEGRIELNVYEKRGEKLVLISPGCFQHDSKLLRR